MIGPVLLTLSAAVFVVAAVSRVRAARRAACELSRRRDARRVAIVAACLVARRRTR